MTWIYGVDNFLDDIKKMLGFYPYPRILWKYAWKYVMPCVVLVSVFCSTCTSPTIVINLHFAEYIQ